MHSVQTRMKQRREFCGRLRLLLLFLAFALLLTRLFGRALLRAGLFARRLGSFRARSLLFLVHPNTELSGIKQ